MTAAQHAFLRIFGHVRDLTPVFARRTHVDQRFTTFTLRQGFIEKSNVNSVTEMSRMIEITRTYTQISALLQQQSDLHKSAIEKLAEVPA